MAGKKGGAAVAAEQKNKPELTIKVRIDKLMNTPNSKLKAFASINIGDFAVHGFRVFENENGLFVSMPSTSYTDGNGNKKYEDIFHPVTNEARESLCMAIREGYEQALTETQANAQSNIQNQEPDMVQKM